MKLHEEITRRGTFEPLMNLIFKPFPRAQQLVTRENQGKLKHIRNKRKNTWFGDLTVDIKAQQLEDFQKHFNP